MPATVKMTKREFAQKLADWYASIPESNHMWAEALVAAALDETHGDLKLTLKLARQEYERDPEGLK